MEQWGHRDRLILEGRHLPVDRGSPVLDSGQWTGGDKDW